MEEAELSNEKFSGNVFKQFFQQCLQTMLSNNEACSFRLQKSLFVTLYKSPLFHLNSTEDFQVGAYSLKNTRQNDQKSLYKRLYDQKTLKECVTASPFYLQQPGKRFDSDKSTLEFRSNFLSTYLTY